MALVAESFWRRLRYTRLRDVLRGRLEGQLDWRYLLAKADLPLEIANTISQVVNKTRLWNSEQVDLTSELVAHFQDALKMDRSAEQLVSEFGDVALAAKLIRRAKKRNRPLWWRTLRAFSWSLGCFLAVYVLLALYQFTERPTLDTDYLAIVNRRVDGRTQGEAAWPHYRKAMLSLGWRNSQPPKILQGRWYQGDTTANLLDSSEGSTLREFLAAHQPQLAELRKAAMAPRLGFTLGQSHQSEDVKLLGAYSPATIPGEPPELISILLGHIQVLNHTGVLLAGDALLAAESSDAQRAYNSLTACLRLVQHVQEPPPLVSALVSFRIERNALDAMENILRDYPELFSDEQLTDLAHCVAAIDPPIDYWLESERTFMFDIVQRIYGNSGRVTHEGVIYLGRIWPSILPFSEREIDGRAERAQQILLSIGLPAINLFMASRDELLAMHNEVWQDEMSKFSKPLWQLTNQLDQFNQLISHSQWEEIRYLPLVITIPALASFRMGLERAAGHREGALIGIALELYHREHGEWPESLKRLSPRFLPNVPVDRINGGPLGYRILKDGALVYSFGTDTDDDQGRPPEEAGKYNVFSPSPITETASPSDIRDRDGDWVIWSTVKTDAE